MARRFFAPTCQSWFSAQINPFHSLNFPRRANCLSCNVKYPLEKFFSVGPRTKNRRGPSSPPPHSCFFFSTRASLFLSPMGTPGLVDSSTRGCGKKKRGRPSSRSRIRDATALSGVFLLAPGPTHRRSGKSGRRWFRGRLSERRPRMPECPPAAPSSIGKSRGFHEWPGQAM